jgi:hypothetical protein
MAFLATMVVLLAAGCPREDVQPTAKDAGISRTAKSGPVEVTLHVAPATVDLSQRAIVEVGVVAEKGATIIEPEYHRALTEGDHQFEYRVVHSEKKPPEPTADGKLRWYYRYDMEFFLPGEYELPPAEVSFVDLQSAQGDAVQESDAEVLPEPQTLKTGPVKVVVRAPEGAPLSPEQLRSIPVLDPVDLPRKWQRSWWAVAVLPLVALAAVVVIARWLRRRGAEMVVQIPAHEWAKQQLAALLAEDLLARGYAQKFYYRISGIVRGYIERRFAVSAPEMTTEEFFVAAASDGRFGRTMTDELQRFLTACDLVKYALHEPQREESDAAVKAAGEFVERTQERPVAVNTHG